MTEARRRRVTIRPATVDDAAAAAACHLACWREAYAGIIPDAALARATSDLDARIERWRQHLTSGAPRWVAVTGGGQDGPGSDVVGFAGTGPGRDADVSIGLELEAIYVRRAWWGTGVGHRLLVEAVGEADAYLWVIERNDRARGFYARHGFVPDGATQHLSAYGADEIRMVRRPAPT